MHITFVFSCSKSLSKFFPSFVRQLEAAIKEEFLNAICENIDNSLFIIKLLWNNVVGSDKTFDLYACISDSEIKEYQKSRNAISCDFGITTTTEIDSNSGQLASDIIESIVNQVSPIVLKHRLIKHLIEIENIPIEHIDAASFNYSYSNEFYENTELGIIFPANRYSCSVQFFDPNNNQKYYFFVCFDSKFNIMPEVSSVNRFC